MLIIFRKLVLVEKCIFLKLSGLKPHTFILLQFMQSELNHIMRLKSRC